MDAVLLQCSHGEREVKAQGAARISAAFSGARVQEAASKPACEQTTHVSLMLYGTHRQDYVLNQVVAWITSEVNYTRDGQKQLTNFAHAELCFEFDLLGNKFENNATIGFSINQFTNLYMKPKMWRSEYRSLPIYISKSKYDALFKLCFQLAQYEIRFDSAGMYASVIAPSALMRSRCKFKHGTFCSRIITEVLQECGIGGEKLAKLEPWRATPNLLSQCFEQDVVGCVPTYVRDT